MKRWLSLMILILGLTNCVVRAETVAVPATQVLRGADLVRARQLARAGNPGAVAALKKLCAEADKRLSAAPFVITAKQHPQPGYDPHDYVSIARYGWPNPATPNGLPYVTRDGEPNPEEEEFDNRTWGHMLRAVRALAEGWYFTGEAKYAECAARQLRAWFLDPATRMNPNLNHAQMMRGKNQGSGTGLIDVREIPSLIDAVLLLRGAPGWTTADEQKLQAWFREYLVWLTTSKNGKKEAEATNNHGTWYDGQVVAIALFVGDREQARRVLERARTKRIAAQIEPDGAQPRELARTLSVMYTLFNLQAFFELAQLGEHAGVDLWSYRTPDGRSIRAALDWVLPYALNEKSWEHKQIAKANFGLLVSLLRQAARVWHEPAYEKALGKIEASDGDRLWANFYSPAS